MTEASLFPEPTELSDPFWLAASDHRLVLQWCDDCNVPIFYPRVACPTCLGTSLSWRNAAGTGVIYSLTHVHNPALRSVLGPAPFLVALVDLDEGVRIATNLVGFDVDPPEIGGRVRVGWIEVDDRSVPVFEPG